MAEGLIKTLGVGVTAKKARSVYFGLVFCFLDFSVPPRLCG